MKLMVIYLRIRFIRPKIQSEMNPLILDVLKFVLQIIEVFLYFIYLYISITLFFNGNNVLLSLCLCLDFR